MSKGKTLEHLLKREVLLYKKYSALLDLYDSLDNDNPNKHQIFDRLQKLQANIDRNAKHITSLLRDES